MQFVTVLEEYQGEMDSAITLGKFDGLHKGHQKLIHRMQEISKEKDLTSIVFAFDMNRESLMTAEERCAYLEQTVDVLIFCPFSEEIQKMEAEEFISEILVKQLKVKSIVVGVDFRFGYEKRGDIHMLNCFAKKYGYSVEVLEKETYQEKEISSTYIKELLKKGDIELSKELLGYPYGCSGRVEHGKKLGRTLGFPTMNVPVQPNKIMPRFGVYACKIYLDDNWYCGVGNVGIKPTVSKENNTLLEVHVFGYTGDAYGKYVKVEFCKFIRPETKFHGVEELKLQVEKDIVSAKEFFHFTSK
ncbi:MAG: riboflavin biosynthesis protein RibF [Candidatus Ruminococcus intestinipullorum]|nr:riboflavin biosynthesis protein RibF [Candidatus Ruminococcus intestinipullorum]